jgi:hypothetical protein
MSKTVEEVLGNLKKTYWGKRILEAKKRGRFNEQDEKLAESWATCACGKQDKILFKGSYAPEDNREAIPWDEELRYLGSNFADDVYYRGRGFMQAANTLVSIQNRAAYLLDQIEKSKKAEKLKEKLRAIGEIDPEVVYNYTNFSCVNN